MKIQQAGELAVVLNVSYDRTADCVSAVRRMFRTIQAKRHSSIHSVRVALDSILIEYQPDPSFEQWLEELKQTDETFSSDQQEIWQTLVVPVCYDLGYDIPKISAQTGLTMDEIIHLHSSAEYQVWMIGFMPGFPYMGELSPELRMKRKNTPDPLIPAGSVAIAEEFVGIYPFPSPGGWHVVGRTPWKILDYSRAVPWTFDYGMNLRFQPISLKEFERIKQ
jgi:KipI family sensor histidine kinase inhibitor